MLKSFIKSHEFKHVTDTHLESHFQWCFLLCDSPEICNSIFNPVTASVYHNSTTTKTLKTDIVLFINLPLSLMTVTIKEINNIKNILSAQGE